MNLIEFRRYRDETALKSMNARLPGLKVKRDLFRAQWAAKANELWIAKYNKDRNAIERLQYELYDPDSGVTRKWADVDAEISSIEYDIPRRLQQLGKVIPLNEAV